MGMLTDPDFVRRLETLHLLARKVLGGSLQADRRSIRKGSGINFADYAEYSLGDDHRSIDWRVYARLEDLLIKMYEIEEDMHLCLLVDASPSMQTKFDQARKLAAALGYIALSNMDRVAVYTLSDELRLILEPSHGRGRIGRFLQTLETAEIAGIDTRFNDCARTFRARHRQRSMVVILSDFLFPGGFEEGLSFLQYHDHQVFCIQVQDERDQRCPLKGDVELQCIETGESNRVTITAREAAAYEQAVRDWNERLRTTCARRGIGLATTQADVPFERIIQYILRRGGLVA